MQEKIQFIKGFHKNEKYRQSFNQLAQSTFGINFETWYENGFWTDKYVPFSYADGDTIMANVSVNKIDLIIQDEMIRALQIGTVMTHPDYRNQGLSRSLMNRVLEEYEGTYDLMYLFANQSVVEFYPKFGFQRVDECQYSLDFSGSSSRSGSIRKLDASNSEELRFIYEFVTRRIPVSRVFGTIHTAELLMFYSIYVFSQDIYYLEQEDVIVLYKQDEKQLDLFDVISCEEVEWDRVLGNIAPEGTSEIVFHFTPDIDSPHLKKQTGSEILFVKGDAITKLPAYFKHPLTSQA